MKYLLVLILTIISNQNFGQKNDYIWFISLSDTLAAEIDFNEGLPVVTHKPSIFDISSTNASFSDDLGNLLFYTNGLQINNQLNGLVENGDSINAGFIANQITQGGYNVISGAFFLPYPEDSTKCILFHMFSEKLPTSTYFLEKLLYTIIDRSANNGLGKVIEKNVPLLIGDETSNFNHASTVRHANGRDWWILVPNLLEPKYYRFLLSPYGILGPEVQEIGFPIGQPVPFVSALHGLNLFSQDGSKYADYETMKGEGFQVFDFDRCTGLLGNPVKIGYEPGFENSNFGGIAFSPSGRFVYMTYNLNNKLRLVQYDLEAPDIVASKVLLSECPGPVSPYECTFVIPVLAPDNKIYVVAKIDTVAYHIIHQPDSMGMACDFEYGGFEIGRHPFSYPPYFPNYRLYDVPGSTCDTLGIDAPVGTVAVEEEGEKAELDIYPNPSGGEVNIRYGLSGKDGQVEVFNLQGQRVRSVVLSKTENALQVHDLQPGIYFVSLLVDGYVQKTGKVVVY